MIPTAALLLLCAARPAPAAELEGVVVEHDFDTDIDREHWTGGAVADGVLELDERGAARPWASSTVLRAAPCTWLQLTWRQGRPGQPGWGAASLPGADAHPSDRTPRVDCDPRDRSTPSSLSASPSPFPRAPPQAASPPALRLRGSRMRTATTSPEPRVRPATASAAVDSPKASATSPASTAPTA